MSCAEKVTVQVSDTVPACPRSSGTNFSDGFTTKSDDERRHRGIGLALVHRLATRAGGTITVECSSATTFTVVLPDAGKEQRRGGRVINTLIVEDDYHVATIHAAYVRKIRGFSVAGHASTAASARSEIRRLAPTLVLLDLYLPDGHGLDLVRESLGGTGHRPDFLVITAARDMGSVRAAMQLGTVHYLVKPFSFAQLEERLAAYRDLRGRIERIDEAGSTTSTRSTDSSAGRRRCPKANPDRPWPASGSYSTPQLTTYRPRTSPTGRNQPLDRPAIPRRAS